MAKLVEHLEARLGMMQAGWKKDPDGRDLPFSVGYFAGGVIKDVAGYATIGLSQHHLPSRVSGRGLHLELIACGYPREGHSPYPQVLQHVGETLISRESALLRGDIFPLPGAIVAGSEMTTVYAANPVYFDDDFFSVTIENGTNVAIVWLVPIGQSEAQYIQDNGWSKFEELLIKSDPDVLDLNRRQIC